MYKTLKFGIILKFNFKKAFNFKFIILLKNILNTYFNFNFKILKFLFFISTLYNRSCFY